MRNKEICDFSLNNRRRGELENNPTHDLSRVSGDNIHLLVEKEGNCYVAFSRRVDELGEVHIYGAVGRNKNDAVASLSDRDIFRYYNMHLTGEVARRFRFYKSDSF